MEIAKGVHAFGLALHLPEHHTLVLADLHIGIEEAMRREGVLVPRQHYKEVVRRVTRVLAQCPGVRRVILNGDLKHEFGRINDQEWREIKRLIDVLRGEDREVVIIKGNHDVLLGPIARDKNIVVQTEFRMGDVLVAHGDAKPSSLKGIKTVIIGHEHPTITLHDKAKAERFKCFLVTAYRFKTLIVQPSFGPLTLGVDLLRGSFLGPFLGRNVMRGNVYVIDEEKDEVLDFGKVKALP